MKSEELAPRCAHSSLFTLPSSLISRLPQVLEDQLHLPSREVAVIDTVARGEQRGQQAVGVVDVTVEATQRVRGRADGEVHRGEFTLGVGTDYHN